MKRSLASGWMCAVALSMASGCGEPERAVIDRPAAPMIAERHDSVALATTTPTPTLPSTQTPAPAPVEPRVTRPTDELTLRRLVVATDVQGHEPVDAGDVIDANAERIYAFIDARNPGDEATLVVTFTSDDGARSVGHVEVSVPAHTARWRTWAFSRHLSPGRWHAEVHTADGRFVDDRAFEVR